MSSTKTHDLCNIEETLGRMRQSLGVSNNSQLAEKLGLSSSGTISLWKKRGKIPLPNLEKVAQLTSVSLDWLVAGEGEPGPTLSDATCPIHEGFVLIPRYNVEGSMGPGAVVGEERVIDRLAFKEEWIRTALGANPKDLALISTVGDSMEPTLHPGDLLMLDCSVNDVRDNAIYALQVNGTLLIKRLQRRVDGQVIVKSDNPAYEPEMIGPEAVDSLKVVGRLVWAGRKF